MYFLKTCHVRIRFSDELTQILEVFGCRFGFLPFVSFQFEELGARLYRPKDQNEYRF